MCRKRQSGQHFLLKAEARTLSLIDIFRLSDEKAFELFKQARWSETDGEPVCPNCGGLEHYHIKTRQQWRCKYCNHTFSVTSGTIFAYNKLPLRIYLAAIALFSNGAKGHSALQMSRDLNVQYKTAWVLSHKIRESLQPKSDVVLAGEVEIDGGYVSHYQRPENKKEDRPDRRLAANQNPNKRAIITLRERGEKHQGASNTVSVIAKSENQDTTLALAQKFVAPGSKVFADEAPAYDVLHAFYPTYRVNHDLMYSAGNGINTNQAESFFSRFRRMHTGQHHKMDNRYLDQYVNEVSYRENTRRESNGAIFANIVQRCAKSAVSRDFCGYWQGNKRFSEVMIAA